MSRDDDPAHIRWTDATIHGDAWWRAVSPASGDRSLEAPRQRIDERFEVRASMTASEAYAIREHLIDAPIAEGLALVTTGLIDRGASRWGERACRYLGRTLGHPRLCADLPLPPSVTRRVERASRPKVIVAGLGRELECFLDERGEFIGAVSTWTITHPRDDLAALGELVALLHSPAVGERLRDELGATALGGGSITVTRRFLAAVPL